MATVTWLANPYTGWDRLNNDVVFGGGDATLSPPDEDRWSQTFILPRAAKSATLSIKVKIVGNGELVVRIRKPSLAYFNIYSHTGDTGGWHTITKDTAECTPEFSETGTYTFRCEGIASATGDVVTSTLLLQGDTDLPGTPSNMAMTATSKTTATASWSASTDTDTYHLHWRISGGTWAEITGIAATSYNLPGLQSGATYEAYVHGVNVLGDGPNSSTQSCTTWQDFFLTAPETMTVGDVIPTIVWNAGYSTAETITLGDSTAVTMAISNAVSETMTIGDAVPLYGNMSEEAASDSLTIGDTTSIAYSVPVSDVIDPVDSQASVVGAIYTFSDTISLTDSNLVDAFQSIRTNFKQMIGTSDGYVHTYDSAYLSDNGTSISAHWRSKTTDFSEGNPAALGKWKTVYSVKLDFLDLSADMDINVYASTDGGATWTASMVTVGTGNSATKQATAFFIVTGQFFDFKVEFASATKTFAYLGSVVEYEINGETS